MSNRRNLSQTADEIVDFIDKNPTDTARKPGGGRDISTEPRVPKGNAGGGQWTSGNSGGGPRKSGGGRTSAPSKPSYPGGDPAVFLDKMEAIARDMAARIGIPAEWILGLSSLESGWLDPHNTSINNPFGVTEAGHNNQKFDSLQKAADYWVKTYGDRVKGSQSEQEFVDRLQDPRRGPLYNTVNKEAWPGLVLNNIHSVEKRLARRRGAE